MSQLAPRLPIHENKYLVQDEKYSYHDSLHTAHKVNWALTQSHLRQIINPEVFHHRNLSNMMLRTISSGAFRGMDSLTELWVVPVVVNVTVLVVVHFYYLIVYGGICKGDSSVFSNGASHHLGNCICDLNKSGLGTIIEWITFHSAFVPSIIDMLFNLSLYLSPLVTLATTNTCSSYHWIFSTTFHLPTCK